MKARARETRDQSRRCLLCALVFSSVNSVFHLCPVCRRRNHQLSWFSQRIRARNFLRSLNEQGGLGMAISVGAAAPDFTLKDQNQKEVKLSEFKDKKNVVLVF